MHAICGHLARGMTFALLLASLPAQAASRKEEQASDLAFARENYVMKSAALTQQDRSRALDYIAAKLREDREFSEPEFLTIALRIAGFADNGHDYFDNGEGWWPKARLPVTLASFPDALVVARAAPEFADLAGARVERIEGLTPAALTKRLHDYFGGPDNYVRWSAMWAIETADILHAMGLARDPGTLRLELVRTDGTKVARTIAFMPYERLPGGGPRAQMFQAAPSAKESAQRWRTAVTASEDPLYLRQPKKLFRMQRLAGLDALYVQFRSHVGSPDDPIIPFIASVEQELAAHGAHHVILDMRFDSGGNSDLSIALMDAIARTAKGRIYIITGQYTFSAGIVTSAKLKHAAGPRALLVGALPGDRIRWWSEGSNSCMPNSHYCLHVTTGLWDLERGCSGEAGCYGDRFDAVVGTLAPEIEAPVTAAAWIAGRDPSMEAIERDLRRRK